MSYSGTVWKEDGTTPITASALNNMEAGIIAVNDFTDIVNGNILERVTFSGGMKLYMGGIQVGASTTATLTLPVGYFASYVSRPMICTACPYGEYLNYSTEDKITVHSWSISEIKISNWNTKAVDVYVWIFGY